MASSYSSKDGFHRDVDGSKEKISLAEEKLEEAKAAAKKASAKKAPTRKVQDS